MIPLDSYAAKGLLKLSKKQTLILVYMAKGLTGQEIADLLGIKYGTVNAYIKIIYAKLGVSTRCEAAVIAAKGGLV